MKLILASRDLMLSSRVEGATRKLGIELVPATEKATICSLCSEEGPIVLLIDLRLPGLDVASLVQAVAPHGVPTIACGPHVHETRLAAAREAGCDLVVTRGQLDRELEGLLQRFFGGDC